MNDLWEKLLVGYRTCLTDLFCYLPWFFDIMVLIDILAINYVTKINNFNQSRHERSRHRLGMGWTNVLPAGKQRCAGNEKFSGISNPIRNGPFCEFPGIVGIGMKNFKTSIIPEISHTPGMGMKFFGNPEKKIFVFSSMSKFDFFTMNRFIRSFYHSLW